MAKKKKPYELELLDEWLGRFGMQDWAVILQSDCDPDEMQVEGAVGCTSWQESTKSAFIQIIDPKKVCNLTRPFDFEEVLVHELLHLKTSLLSSMQEDETLTDRILHTLIDDMARAMVDIKNTERAKYEVLSVRRGKQETDPKDKA